MAKQSSLFKTLAIVIATSALTFSVATGAVIGQYLNKKNGNNTQLPNGGAEEKEIRDVASIEKTGEYGLIDEYTITYTDGSKSTFIVANADSDEPGINVFPSSDGYTPEVKLDSEGNFVVDGNNTGIPLIKTPVKDVRSIVSIEKTETNGLIDTYTITYTDNTTSTFLVVNGANGEQGIQGLPGENGVTPTISINDQGYWVINGEATNFKAQGDNGASLVTGHGVPDANYGQVGDTYLDVDNGNIYTKTDAGWGEPIGNNQGAGVLVNNGAPSANDGKVGDTYIDASTGNIYVKGDEGWGQPIGNNQGSSFLTGNGEPSANQGKQGDTYMDVSTGQIYTKGDSGWSSSLGSIMGPQGPVGPQGPAGTGISVGHGDPTTTGVQGNVGDSYIDVDTGNIYTKDENGWGSPIGNNQGASVLVNNGAPDANQGKVGDTYIDASTGNVYVKNETGWGEPIGNNQGASFLSGNGEPAADAGKVGDTYMNTSTGEIYQKTDAGWISSGNSIMGPQGPIGISLHTGTGAPSADLGVNQDSYIDTQSWNYYVKENGAWVLKGNIHGANGAAGTTPHIGDNGNWWIGETDTGVNANGNPGTSVVTGHGNPNGDNSDPNNPIAAQGGNVGDTYIDLDNGQVYVKDENGWQVDTSGATGIQGTTPHIGDNGNWWIGEQDTGVAAQGQNGQAGASVLTGNSEPTQGLGSNNDSYINTSTWDFYVKENGAWVLKGNIQGAQGIQGQSISVTSCIKTGENGLVDTYTITFSNGDTATFDVINGAAGAAGANGADGHSPVISIDNTSGNWILDGNDTGVHAQGVDGAQGATGNGISNIVVTASTADETSYRIIFTDGSSFDYTVANGVNGQDGADGTCMRSGDVDPAANLGNDGDSYINTTSWDYYVKENGAWVLVGNIKGIQGVDGNDGRSVTSIAKTGTEGLVDTYTITYSDNTTSTFTVTNGQDGTNGNTVMVGIGAPTDATGGVNGDSYIDSNTWNYYKKVAGSWELQGNIKGDQGEQGVSITDVSYTSSSGLVDTYTITYSNSTTSTFTVTNGQDGNTVITGNAAPTDQGVNGDSYINLSTWDFYVKENGAWVFKGNIKASSLLTGNGAPAAGNGKVGDSYLDVDTGNVYQKTDTGWGDPIGNIEGANFLTGTGAPGAGLGKEGDSYLDVASGYIYQKSDTGWGDPIGNVKGSNFLTGNGDPANDLGKVGDSYLDIVTGKIYTKTDTGWGTEIGNIHQFFDVTFDTNEGSAAPATQNIQEGRKVTAPDSDPTKDGWIFQGWFTDAVGGSRWDFDKDVVSSNITLYAHWAKFKVENGILTECTATGDIVIPEFFDGQLVTGIADDVFKNNTSITSVTLPYTLTNIGNSAFEGCTGLTSIIIPHNVKTIGNDAFKGCSSMAYIYFESVNSNVVTPLRAPGQQNGGLESIGDGAFAGCTGLKAFALPNTVEHIGQGAFSASKGWTSYGKVSDMFPDATGTVTIGNSAPSNPSYGDVFIDTTNSVYDITVWTHFNNSDSWLFKANYGWLTSLTSGSSDPSDADSADFNAFYINTTTGEFFVNCASSLQSLSIPFVGSSSSGTENAYLGYLFGASSSNENNAYVPGTITVVNITGDAPIGNGAFKDCKFIQSISITGDPESIGLGAFEGCERLSTLTLPYIGGDSGNENFVAGNGAPSNSLNAVFYMDVDTDDIYIKTDGTFALVSNLSNMLGGAAVSYGNGAPSSSLVTDIFVDCDSGDLYIATSSGWQATNISVLSPAPKHYFAYIFGMASLSDHAYHYVPDSLETVIMTSANGDDRNVIPASAFSECFNIETIVLPNNLKEIGTNAFSVAYGLESIVMSDSVTRIGPRAFYRCYGLEDFALPQALKVIGLEAFVDCHHLTSVVIPEGVTVINQGTFSGCFDLIHVILPNSLKRIETEAFKGCSDLKSIIIPNSVEYIGYGALRSCNELESLSIPFVGSDPVGGTLTYDQTIFWIFGGNNPGSSLTTITLTGGNSANRDAIPDLAFYGCSYVKHFNINFSAVTIGDDAFRGCTSLVSIALPSNLNSIGDRAFANSGLVSVVVPGSVASIGDNAFNSCTSLTAFVLETGVEKTIGDRIILGCTSLKTAVINGPITSFGSDVLDGDNALEYVSLGYGITTLEQDLFYSRANLKVVVLPESLVTIEKSAFQGCTSLVTLNIPYGVTTIGVQAFYGDTSLENIVLPNTVTSIGTYSFANCSALKYVTLSESLTEIGIQAFDSCSSIQGIYIPASVRTINSNAFKDCTGLKHVIMNEGVQTIQDFAFSNCSSLQTISIPDTVHNMGKGIFSGCSSLSSLTLPFTGGSYNGYGDILTSNGTPDSAVGSNNDLFVDTLNMKIWRKIDGEWYNQFVLGRSDNHQAGTITTGDSDPTVAWTSGEDFYVNLSTGEYFEINHSDPDDFHSVAYLQDYLTRFGYAFVMPNGMYQIDQFNDVVPASLKSVSIKFGDYWEDPSDPTNFAYFIDEGSFQGCSSIEIVILGENIVAISDNAFKNCVNLKTITLPKNLIAIENSAFANCEKMETIVIPKGVMYFGAEAFYNCSLLKYIVFEEDNTVFESFGYSCFENCTSLLAISFPQVTDSDPSAFKNCASLKSVSFGDNSYFEYGYPSDLYAMFEGCSSLETIKIPWAYSNTTRLTITTWASAAPTSQGNDGDYWFDTSHNQVFYKIGGQWELAFAGDGFTLYVQTNLTFPTSNLHVGDCFIGKSTSTNGPELYVYNGSSWDELDNLNFYYNRFAYLFGSDSSAVPESLTNVIITNSDFYNFVGYFEGCSHIKNVILPDNVKGISANMFKGCTGLSYAPMNDNITAIGKNAYYGCSGITAIAVPASVEEFGLGCFQGCTSLESLKIPFIGSNVANNNNDYIGHLFGATNSSSNATYIPESLKTVEVTGDCNISYRAFYGCSHLENLIISGTPTSYDSNNQFEGCSSLKYLYLSYLGNNPTSTYGSLSSLFGNVNNIPTTLNTVIIANGVGPNHDLIPQNAFQGCPNIENLILPEGITTIGKQAFANAKIKNVVVPEGVTTLGNQMFYYSEIETIIIPDSVTSIGTEPFRNSSKLTYVKIGNGLTSIPNNAFRECPMLSQVDCGSGLTSIGTYAFYQCKNLSNFVFNEGITSIGEAAFYGTGLKTVVLPSTLQTMGSSVFFECYSLYYVNLFECTSLVSVSQNAFYYCESLVFVRLPKNGNTFTTIESSAFAYCISLSDISNLQYARNIGNSAFKGCKSLYSITVGYLPTSGSGANTIGQSAFEGCIKLTYVQFNSNNYYPLSIQQNAFKDCTSLKAIKIGQNTRNSVGTIAKNAFSGCTNVESVELPYLGSSTSAPYKLSELLSNGGTNNVKTVVLNSSINLVDSAFSGCGSMTSCSVKYLESGFTSIGNKAFSNCKSLLTFSIPYSVNTLGTGLFEECTSLVSVSFSSTSNPYLTSINDRCFYRCSSLIEVNYAYSITSIGNQAFYGCTSLKEFKQGYVGGTFYLLQSIGANAFEGCTALITVSLNDNATSIGQYAFSKCTSLSTVTLGNNVASIGQYAFSYCDSLQSISIPAAVTEISDYTFYCSPQLTYVELKDGLTSIGNYAFYGCAALKALDVPDSVTTLGSHFVQNCNSLESLTIPGLVKSSGSAHIGDFFSSFDSNGVNNVPDSLKVVVITGNAPVIELAFGGCSHIETIRFEGNPSSIANNAFRDCTSLKTLAVPYIGSNSTGIGTLYADSGDPNIPLYSWDSGTDTGVDPSVITHIDYNPYDIDFNNAQIGDLYYAVYTYYGDTYKELVKIYDDYGDLWYMDAIDYGWESNTDSYWWYIGDYKTTMPYSDVYYSFVYGEGTPTANGVVPSSSDLAYFDVSTCTLYRVTSSTRPGSENDLYVDTATGWTYLYVNGSWVKEQIINIGSLTNLVGDTDPDDSLGDDGNKYINLSTYDYYEKITGHWVYHDNFKKSHRRLGYWFDGFNNEHGIPSTLKTIEITAGATAIIADTFKNVTSLEEIILPDSVKTIGANAFSGCTNLKTVSISTTLTSIGGAAFKNCTSLESFSIPASVTEILASAFEGCSSLNYVYFAESTGQLAIYSAAFKNCTSLESVAFPSTYSSLTLGDAMFEGCTSLKSLTLKDLMNINSYNQVTRWINEDPTSADADMYSTWLNTSTGDVFYVVNGNWELAFNVKPYSTSTIYNVDNPSNSLGNNGDVCLEPYNEIYYRIKVNGAWSNKLYVGQYSIGYLFSESGDNSLLPESLKTVVLSTHLDETYAYSFAGCMYLETVVLPDDVAYIGAHAFEECYELKSVNMPTSLAFIGDCAFYCCVGLENVEFCGLIDRIGEYAFSSCYSLSSLSLDVRVIGEGAFDGCVNLLQVSLVQDYLTEIGDEAFCSCGLLANVTFGTRLSIHPASCTIGEEAFRGCVALQYIDFCGSVITSVGQSAFSNCSSLTFISFNDGLTSIGANAFEFCYGLAAIRLPASLGTIGENAFKDCYSLKAVLYGGANVTAWDAISIGSGNECLAGANRKYNA